LKSLIKSGGNHPTPSPEDKYSNNLELNTIGWGEMDKNIFKLND